VLTYQVSFLPVPVPVRDGTSRPEIAGVESFPLELDADFAHRAGVDPRGELRPVENGVKVVFNPTSTSPMLAVAYANASADELRPLQETEAGAYEVEAELPLVPLRPGEEVELVFFTLE